jgi:GNAT superfamily N-acetyltransferase
VSITYEWRGAFTDPEVGDLHARAFERSIAPTTDRPWNALVKRHSLGWVTARRGGTLVGFVNVLWDGRSHAWIQDLIVASTARRQGLGRNLVGVATEKAVSAGCEWLHVDFDDALQHFYVEVCGFAPSKAGLKRLD